MARLRLALVVQAIDKATAPIRKIRQAVSRVGRATGLDRVSSALGGVGRGLFRVGGEAARFGKRFGVIIAAAAGAAGLFFGQFGAAGDRIAKTADKLGLGVVELQRLQYAAKLAGIPVRTFDMAFQRFTRRTAEAAAGTGEALGALKFLGIALKDSEGRLRPASTLLEEVADKLATIEDPALRVRVAFKLFDSEGVAMVNMLQKGSKSIRDAGDEAERLGVMTEKDARASEEFVDSLTRMQQAAQGLRIEIGRELLPKLTGLIDRFQQWLIAIKPAVVHEMELFLSDLAATVNWLADMWSRATRTGGKFLDWLAETVPPIRGWIDMARDWGRQTSWVAIAVGALTLLLGRGLIVAILGLFIPLAKLGLALLLAGARMVWLGLGAVGLLARALGGVLLSALGFATKGVKALTAVMLRNPFIALAVGLALVAWWMVKRWDEIWQASKDAWARVKAVIDFSAWNIELSQFSLLIAVAAWFSGTSEVVKLAWRDIRAAVGVDAWLAELRQYSAFNVVEGWFNGTVEFVSDWWAALTAGVDFAGWLALLSDQNILSVVRGWVAGGVGVVSDWWSRLTGEVDVRGWIYSLSGYDLIGVVNSWISGSLGQVAVWWHQIRSAVDVDAWIALA